MCGTCGGQGKCICVRPDASYSVYAGFKIQESDRCGAAPGQHGWQVSRDGVNPLPGGTYGTSRESALQLVDVFCAVDDSLDPGQRFWHLLRAIQRQQKLGDNLR